MQRVLYRIIPSNPFSSFYRRFREARRLAKDASHLDALPRDRLKDIGVAAHTDANRRHSGQRGRVSQPTLW